MCSSISMAKNNVYKVLYWYLDECSLGEEGDHELRNPGGQLYRAGVQHSGPAPAYDKQMHMKLRTV